MEVGDPAKGTRTAEGIQNQGKLWCDASITRVVLEYDGKIIEDAAWLRSTDDVSHINIAELDLMMRGVNLIIK